MLGGDPGGGGGSPGGGGTCGREPARAVRWRLGRAGWWWQLRSRGAPPIGRRPRAPLPAAPHRPAWAAGRGRWGHGMGAGAAVLGRGLFLEGCALRSCQAHFNRPLHVGCRRYCTGRGRRGRRRMTICCGASGGAPAATRLGWWRLCGRGYTGGWEKGVGWWAGGGVRGGGGGVALGGVTTLPGKRRRPWGPAGNKKRKKRTTKKREGCGGQGGVESKSGRRRSRRRVLPPHKECAAAAPRDAQRRRRDYNPHGPRGVVGAYRAAVWWLVSGGGRGGGSRRKGRASRGWGNKEAEGRSGAARDGAGRGEAGRGGAAVAQRGAPGRADAEAILRRGFGQRCGQPPGGRRCFLRAEKGTLRGRGCSGREPAGGRTLPPPPPPPPPLPPP